MTITKQTIANKLTAYLHHRLSLAQLVDWAERALMDGDFAVRDAARLSPLVGRLGLADVRAFGLTWDDCEELLAQLGYAAHVEISAVSSSPATVRERTAKRYGK
jgi:hypothetical protein